MGSLDGIRPVQRPHQPLPGPGVCLAGVQLDRHEGSPGAGEDPSRPPPDLSTLRVQPLQARGTLSPKPGVSGGLPSLESRRAPWQMEDSSWEVRAPFGFHEHLSEPVLNDNSVSVHPSVTASVRRGDPDLMRNREEQRPSSWWVCSAGVRVAQVQGRAASETAA